MTAELAIPARSSIPEKMEYARTLAGANLLPDAFRRNPENVLWAIEYSEALRLPTIAAITGIHVIEGKPTPSAALMSALVRRAGHKLRVRYEPSTEHGIRGRAWCEITRRDDPDFVFRSEWTVERARDAELCRIDNGQIIDRTRNNKTGNWQKHYIGMMKRRATSECARDACEEDLLGMHYLPEEMGAEVDPEGTPLRGHATVIDLASHGRGGAAAPAGQQPVGDPPGEGGQDEPDWDALLAEYERNDDRQSLLNLYHWAAKLRPGDADLAGRIRAAGERMKAARESQPVDGEVVDDPHADPETAKRERRMFALLNETDVANDRDRRLALLGLIVGQDIATSKDLTHEQRGVIVGWLEDVKAQGRIGEALTVAQEEAQDAQAAEEMAAADDEARAEGGAAE